MPVFVSAPFSRVNLSGLFQGETRPRRPYLHEAFQLIKLAVQVLKILFEKLPESVVEHDFDQNTEGLFFRHLSKEGRMKPSCQAFLNKQVLNLNTEEDASQKQAEQIHSQAHRQEICSPPLVRDTFLL